jgi:hypothetical protein
MVMMLSLNLLRITTGTERQMVLNEVATQVTGFAVDIMEHVGNKWFDEVTDETGVTIFPLVTSQTQLTASTSFGNVGDGLNCNPADFYDPDCNDIDDFHGMTVNRDLDGIPYTATISVRYVREDDPSTVTDKSFAKEVSVVITSPYLLLGNTPLQVTLTRVYAYNRIITAP